MRKLTYILLFSLLLTGCSGIKQGWRNFNAYYNTFYNTKQYYSLGLDQNLRQTPEFNPYRPIRVHLPPGSAGSNDFQRAIEGGSSILRDHENSKYLLPAIFVIGRSYYYRSEFFSALEKFQELERLAEGKLREEAFFWQGRTYLELGNYPGGIQQLEYGLDGIDEWDPVVLSNVRLLLAELYTAVENYERAISFLEAGLQTVADQNLAGRAYFLKGQLYEEMDLDVQALAAFSSVNEFRVDFDLEYHARKKEAETARRLGYYSQAETIFRRLERDDKFTSFRAEMRYEIARTEQLSGNHVSAVLRYRELLEDRTVVLTPLIIAMTNYGLAEVYRDAYTDYTTAAEYFSRAASQRIDAQLLPSHFKATEMAESFGAYARLRAEIARKDSLLGLSELSDEELERFILQVQADEQQRLEVEQRSSRELVRFSPEEELLATESAGETSEFGFLNISNPAVMNEASLRFQAVWGDRPLADNWRRSAVLSGSRFDQMIVLDDEGGQTDLAGEAGSGGLLARVDLGEIPFTAEAREQMSSELQSLYYELGNVFFLTLDMPDSAAIYYKKVLEQEFGNNLSEMALFSLSELNLLMDREEEANYYFERLQEKSPNSVYLRRIAERLGFDPDDYSNLEQETTAERFSILQREDNGMTHAELAAGFLGLAEAERSRQARALLMFEASQSYMRAAREEMPSLEPIRHWLSEKERIDRVQREFETLRDSSRVMLNDPTLSEAEMLRWQQIAQRELQLPEIASVFPFKGAYWDSTRSILGRLETEYQTSDVIPRVRILLSELRIPESTGGIDSESAIVSAVDSLEGVTAGMRSDQIEIVPDTEAETMPERAFTDQLDGADGLRFTDSYSVSLYSYLSESRALRRAQELAAESFEVYVCRFDVENRTYWRVSTGIYSTANEALTEAERLREPYDVQNFIQRMNNSCRAIEEPVEIPQELTGLFSAENESSFTIVLYSFTDVDNAQRTANHLREIGLRAIISQARVDNQLIYRVSVGQFTSISEAISGSAYLPEPYSNQNIIVRIVHSEI